MPGRRERPQAVLAALADPTRRAVFERLTSRGPASASRLATELPVSRQAISKHLTVLDDAGLVTRAMSGRSVEYTAAIDGLDDVTRWMDRVGSEWDTRLERLRDSLG